MKCILYLTLFSFVSLNIKLINCQQYKSNKQYYLQEFTANNITNNFQLWNNDMAIMFYAPWCKYCKQLIPYMESMAIASKTNKNFIIGKFNCEEPKINNKICVELGVTHYPSIFFIGYGNFNQAPIDNIFGTTKYPQVVQYRLDLLYIHKHISYTMYVI